MRDSIVHIFTGRYIDLEHLVSISDAKFIDRMGSGGFYVGFEINLLMIDQPIVYERKFEYDETDRHSSHRQKPVMAPYSNRTLAEIRLQAQVDDLVKQWKEYKEGK